MVGGEAPSPSYFSSPDPGFLLTAVARRQASLERSLAQAGSLTRRTLLLHAPVLGALCSAFTTKAQRPRY